MTYFKSNNTDLSAYVSGLRVVENDDYVEHKNALGTKRVDYINKKREIEVTFIPLKSSDMITLLSKISFQNTISFLNPNTGVLENNVNTIVDNKNISYYTIQSNKVMFNEITIVFKEL